MRPANEELLSGKSLPFKVSPNNYIYRKEIARTHCEQFHCGLRSKYCSEEIVSLKENEGFCWGPAMLIFNQRFARIFRALHSIILHVVRVHGHKSNVDNRREGDEEFTEGVKDEVGEYLCTSNPQPTAVTDTEDVAGPLTAFDQDILYRRSFIVVVILQFAGHIIFGWLVRQLTA